MLLAWYAHPPRPTHIADSLVIFLSGQLAKPSSSAILPTNFTSANKKVNALTNQSSLFSPLYPPFVPMHSTSALTTHPHPLPSLHHSSLYSLPHPPTSSPAQLFPSVIPAPTTPPQPSPPQPFPSIHPSKARHPSTPIGFLCCY